MPGLPQYIHESDGNSFSGSQGPLQAPTLMSGKPVNHETVAEKIRNGGPLMPGYSYTLIDQDMADLLSYIREGGCCWEDKEEHDSPPNPRYEAQ